MEAIRFIVDTLLWLLTLAFVLRLLFQWVRADFRDPMADAIVRVTNWLIVPLRRLLPPIGKIDTATVLAVLATAPAAPNRCSAWRRGPGHPLGVPAHHGRRLGRLDPAHLPIRHLLYWLTSFVSPGGYAPGVRLLAQLCEPILEAGASSDSAHRANRFLLPVGVDCNRRVADTSALNMHSYMPEITANDASGNSAGSARSARRP